MQAASLVSPVAGVFFLSILILGFGGGYLAGRFRLETSVPPNASRTRFCAGLCYGLAAVSVLAILGIWQPMFLLTLPLNFSAYMLGPMMVVWIPVIAWPAFLHGRHVGLESGARRAAA